MRFHFVLLVAAAAVPFGLTTEARADDGGAFRVMSFNVWVGGGEPGSDRYAKTVETLKASGAHVVGLQEAGGNVANFARDAGFEYHDVERQIISTFPIVERLSKAKRGGGVRLELPSGRTFVLYNVHLTPYPYGPYDIMRKEGFGPVDAVTQEFAGNGHIPDVRHVLDALANEVKPGEPVFWTGDFNVPSHLDWTPAAKDLHGGYVVPWPVSAMLDGAGFLDAYRVVHPDPVAQPGITWTPSKPLDDPEEVHDRIDFVYLRGDVRVEDAHVVGESEELADIVIEEFPSDHRGVVATVTLGVEQR